MAPGRRADCAGVDWPILNVLSPDDRRAILSRARRRRFARNEVIFHEGDPGHDLHLVAKGHVGIQRSTPLGDVVMLQILGSGSVFGELAVISPGPRSATAVAVDQVETLCLRGEELELAGAARAAIDQVLLQALAQNLRRTSTLLVESLYLSAQRRIFLRLCELVSLFADAERDGPVEIPLTQEQIGQLAGTVRPTANRVLREAQEAGILRMTRGRIEILDREALARRAR